MTVYDDASYLYNGGWRSEDKDDLMLEYDIDEDYAVKICEVLAELEERQVNG